jgi:hypothetical protein
MNTLRLRRDAVWREADGEVLALDGDFNNYVSTNATGSLLWKRLAEGTSREALIELLVSEFGIDAGAAAADVDAFLAELAANGFLEG